ncbi:hypothetical protein [Aneurinibacillus aneurinilyticus]|nr:hypothetical protein [Aneurinibacillus aneurinilyticus]MED0671419.1 hypothetical protein [Aneurinibacillus aneurinilyticus]
MIHTFEMKTSQRDQFVEITDKVRELIAQQHVQNGVVTVYCPQD